MKDAGYNTMTLNSSITAVGFYQKMGMVIIEKTNHRLRSGVELKAYKMEKNLA
ncbi:MAG: hypothetical protein JWM96_1008 [Alphaproteobacteria bacterium]|nr:hypothetical protein [Alphaproteobacteria bacterium]